MGNLWQKVTALLSHRKSVDSAAPVPPPAVDYRRLIEDNLDLIVQVRLVGDSFQVEYASPACLSFLGWNAAELMQLRPDEIFPPQSMPTIVTSIHALLGGQPFYSLQTQISRKDQPLCWCTIRSRLLEPDTGRGCLIVSTLADISEQKQVEEELAGLVMIDTLTGIGNRRAFDASIEQAWQESLATGRPLSLVMVDVDHFKFINDEHGHQVGDQCLKAIAAAAKRLITDPAAFVGRYGGEELAVLLPATGLSHASRLAQQLCETVAELRVGHVKKLTVSCGVSTARLNRGSSKRPETLIAAADTALYLAKDAGRNRIAISPGPTSTHYEYPDTRSGERRRVEASIF